MIPPINVAENSRGPFPQMLVSVSGRSGGVTGGEGSLCGSVSGDKVLGLVSSQMMSWWEKQPQYSDILNAASGPQRFPPRSQSS